MRLIEKKIRDEIEQYKQEIKECEDIKDYRLIEILNGWIIKFEWILSELQKESDLMQEMLDAINEMLIIICKSCQQKDYRRCWKEKGFCKTYDKYKSLIQKVKQELNKE